MTTAVMLARPQPLSQVANAPAIVAAARIGRSAALLLGEHHGRLPRLGLVTVAGTADSARLRLTAWPQARSGHVWFLAVVQFAEALPAPGATLSVLANGQPELALAHWPATLGTVEAMAGAIAARTEGRAAELSLFLADLAIAAPKNMLLRQTLKGFLAAAAEDDGAVEIVGSTAGALVLQGWGHDADSGAVAILSEPVVLRAPIGTATFRRADIAAPATGLVQVLPLPAGVEPAAPSAVHVVAQGRLRRRRVLPARTLLDQGETALHLRDMLPRISGPAETLAALKGAARPVYAGVETISRLGRPVAVALDAVVTLPGRSAYVMGWLLDPAGQIAAVALSDGARLAARLDGRWTRVARPDVSAGFRSDPRFPAMSGDLHGFAAYLAADLPDQAEALHLALELADGEVGFLPAAPVAGSVRTRLRRAAGTVDLFKPTGLDVIETALAPLIGAAAGLQASPQASVRRAPRGAPTALLLALPAPNDPPAAMLSGFLTDPPARGEETLVIILGPDWQGTPLAALEGALAFYGLAAGILIAEEEPEPTEAWEIGARAVQADRYLCLGGAGLAGPHGWRRALAEGTPGNVAAVAAPMLLYEDGSVRSLGFDTAKPAAAPPYLRVRRRAAGLPAAAIGAGAARHCLGSTLAGAMVSARAHADAGGFCGFGLTAAAHELAFFLRLAARGGRCATLAAIRVVAPEPAEHAAPWRKAARLAEALALHGLIAAHGREGG